MVSAPDATHPPLHLLLRRGIFTVVLLVLSYIKEDFAPQRYHFCFCFIFQHYSSLMVYALNATHSPIPSTCFHPAVSL